MPALDVPVGPWMLVVGGLLVGVGVTLAGGCTSGHGVCGMARLSPRSLAATLTFMATAFATVFVIRHGEAADARVLGYAIGLVFGLGIVLSGMANPAKVLNFFDIAGTWDPSLAFVMGGALAVTFVGYRLVLAPAPLVADHFHLPTPGHRRAAGRRLRGLRRRLGHRRVLPGRRPARASAPARAGPHLRRRAARRHRRNPRRPRRRARRPARRALTQRRERHERLCRQHRRETLSRRLSVKPEVTAFFDPATNTISYVVKDPASNACAIVDCVMDIDYAAGRITYDHADEIIDFVRKNGLKVEWLIETHVHADHLSAAPYIQQKLGGKIGIGDNITVVQDTFGKVFNEGTEFQRDGSQFDRLFDDGDTYTIGTMTAFAIHTPGHTPACMTHVIGDAAFVGDTLFMPDGG